MSTRDFDMCKAFAEKDDNILGVGIIEDMKFVARYSKPNSSIPIPEGEKLQELVIQSELFVSMAKASTEWFGRFRYITVSFETHDILLFSLPQGGKNNNKPRLLGIRVLRPYDMMKILEKLHIV